MKNCIKTALNKVSTTANWNHKEVRRTDQVDYLNKLGWLRMLHPVKAKIMKLHFQCCVSSFDSSWRLKQQKIKRGEK